MTVGARMDLQTERLVSLISYASFLILCSLRQTLQKKASLVCSLHSYHRWLTTVVLFMRKKQKGRRIWSLPRPNVCWFDFVYYDANVENSVFRSKLRISKSTFDIILRMTLPGLVRKDTNWRRAIVPEKVLAIGLYRMAHGVSFISLADTFNIGSTTAREAFADVIFVLNSLRKYVIKFPCNEEERTTVISTFQERSSLPNILGAIDGTHVNIRSPHSNAEDYFSRYHKHDVVCQGVVDGKCRFIDFAAGFPGKMHDSRVMRNTRISHWIDSGFESPIVNINNKPVRPFIVGDSAYPLLPALMKPYSDKTKDRREKNFNYQLSRARVSVECAFGMLKSRFRLLLKGIDDDLYQVSKIIMACVVLHNICIDLGDEWQYDVGPTAHDDVFAGNGGDRLDGEEIRETLKNYLYQDF